MSFLQFKTAQTIRGALYEALSKKADNSFEHLKGSRPCHS